VKASAEQGIADRFPVALTVAGGHDPLPAGLADKVRAVAGVTGTATVVNAQVEIGDEEWSVVGVPSEITEVVPGLTVAADDLVVSGGVAHDRGWSDGQHITLTVASQQRQLIVRVDHLGDMAQAVVSLNTLDTWAPKDPTTEVWASVDTRDAASARRTLEDTQALGTGLVIGGSLSFIVVLTQVLDVLLMIATGLLGAAVLIALIGVGNTLGLSVLERSRESALLRALGLQRSQLRTMLAIEALLLAVGGALVGIAVGIGFGALGTWALMQEMRQATVLRVSPPQLLVDAGIAVLAGLVASVLPARRAVRAAPTEALAED